MSGKLPDQLLQWLYRVLQSQYLNPVLTYQDVSLILLAFPNSNFKPSTKIYLNENGDQKLLLNLEGSIPIASSQSFLSSVPFEISIPHEYPQQPPIIFIRPTKESAISPNNNVDNNGRFYHPVCSTLWLEQNSNIHSNDGIKPSENRLLLLINTLFDTINKNLPLIPFDTTPPPQYRNSIQTHPTPQPQPQLQSPVPPPLPMKPSSSTTATTSLNHSSHDINPLPRYPSNSSISSSSTQRPPPLPPKNITRVSSSTSITRSANTNSSNVNIPIYSSNSNSSINSTVHASISPPSVSTQMNVPAAPSNPSASSALAKAPLLPPNPHRAQTIQGIQEKLGSIIQNELKPEFVKEVYEPIQKLDQEIKYFEEKKLRDIQQLEYWELQSKMNQELLSGKINDANALLKECRDVKRPVIEKIDDIFIPETPVYSQLYDLITQDESITDTFYYLEKAHDNGAIKFDNYLSAARSLAREQCMIKLHIEKLVDLCGLNK